MIAMIRVYVKDLKPGDRLVATGRTVQTVTPSFQIPPNKRIVILKKGAEATTMSVWGAYTKVGIERVAP